MADMTATIPVKPTVFPEPFANSGDTTSLPQTTTTPGKASFDAGFPEECSKPLADGGLPPSRIDFNSIFKLITEWLHYFQSGGLVTYNPDLNYVTPALVFHNGTGYQCLSDNGPAVASVGIKIPGAVGSETYWKPSTGELNINHFGNNANSYLLTGCYYIEDAYATLNFPVIGSGGFLTVSRRDNNLDQAFVLRTDATKLYRRNSTDGGATWSTWTKVVHTNDIRGDAYCQRFISTANPDNAVGKDNDLWIVYR